jgi:hypothetical protein
VLIVDVVSHRQRRRAKIRLGLVIAGLVAAGSASLPTLLGPDASAGQPPFTTNPTGTARATPTKPPALPANATSPSAADPTPSQTATKPASPPVGKCIPDYTDNNWCAGH